MRKWEQVKRVRKPWRISMALEILLTDDLPGLLDEDSGDSWYCDYTIRHTPTGWAYAEIERRHGDPAEENYWINVYFYRAANDSYLVAAVPDWSENGMLWFATDRELYQYEEDPETGDVLLLTLAEAGVYEWEQERQAQAAREQEAARWSGMLEAAGVPA